MLIRTPHGLSKIALRLLDVLIELFLLGLIKLDVVGFITDRLPREEFPRLFAHRLSGFGDSRMFELYEIRGISTRAMNSALDTVSCTFPIRERERFNPGIDNKVTYLGFRFFEDQTWTRREIAAPPFSEDCRRRLELASIQPFNK